MDDLRHYCLDGKVHVIVVRFWISLTILTLVLTAATSEKQLQAILH